MLLFKPRYFPLLLLSEFSALVGAVNLDYFGIKEIYPSDPSKILGNWRSRWDRATPHTLTTAKQIDPHDPATIMRGAGAITLDGGVCEFLGSIPRLYIRSPYDWENVEFTAYGKYKAIGAPLPYSGLTLVARTSHGDFDDGCSAPAYYARIYLDSGEAKFLKEFFHEGSTIVYSDPIAVSLFQGGLPIDKWIGMKFVVYNLSQERVKLEFYIDLEEGINGGNWTLVHEMIDAPREWPRQSDSPMIPPRCQVQDGDTVLGAKKYCFLRSDGDNETLVLWRMASVRNILPFSLSTAVCPNGGIEEGDVCCAAECGICGGVGCGNLPGGASACCTEKILAETDRTCDRFPPPCIIVGDDPLCSTGFRNDETCCPATCGACGGKDCSLREGGAAACCSGNILDSGRSCNNYRPPCNLEAPELSPHSKPGQETPPLVSSTRQPQTVVGIFSASFLWLMIAK